MIVIYSLTALYPCSCTWGLMLSLPACSPRLQAPFLPARHPLQLCPPPHFPARGLPPPSLEILWSLGGLFSGALHLEF